MAFKRNINGFDQCDPPVCPEDVVIGNISVTCTEDAVLHIIWNISNPSDKDLNFNAIIWSCDNQDFNNTSYPTNDVQPYTTAFDILDCSGIIYLKAKIRVGTTFIESDVETFNTKLCGTRDKDYAVPVIWCGECPEAVSTPPQYSLYVRSSTIPSLPVYFHYGGFCWNIISDDNKILIENLPVGTILTDVDNTFSSCEDCCLKTDCPNAWVELPEGAKSFDSEKVGTFYFEYQTYVCPDRLYVVKNFTEEDCNAEGPFTPPSEKILFDTGCVGTSLTSSPSFFVSNPECIGYDAPTYGFCVTIRESELPIGIVNDCDCSSNCSTLWSICVVTPDGETTSWAGGNECMCEEVDEGKWYCVESDTGTLPYPSMVGHWKLNEITGTTVEDFSGNNYDGIADVNTSLLTAESKPGSNMVRSFNFDAQTKDYHVTVTSTSAFSFDDSGSPSSKPFSISLWANIVAGSPQTYFLSKFHSSDNNKQEWFFGQTGKLYFRVYGIGAGSVYRLADDPLSLGWHHLCVVYDNEDINYTPITAANNITLSILS